MTLPLTATAKSRADFAVAERIAALVSPNPLVAAFSVGGSIARGIADRYSDLDVFVYCIRFPSLAERRAWVEALGGTHWRTHDAPAGSGLIKEGFIAGGARVDLNLLLVATVEACLRAVLEKHNVTPVLQAFVGGFVGALPLHGRALHEGWAARAAAYPVELRREQVRAHLFIDPFWIDMFIERGHTERMCFLESLCRVEREVLSILVGLNRLYAPTQWKRLQSLIGAMRLAPHDLYERLDRVLTLDVREATHELWAVVQETFDLVERHMPGLDVASARKHFVSDPGLAGYVGHPEFAP